MHKLKWNKNTLFKTAAVVPVLALGLARCNDANQ